jgi:hypothetical protein
MVAVGSFGKRVQWLNSPTWDRNRLEIVGSVGRRRQKLLDQNLPIEGYALRSQDVDTKAQCYTSQC